MTGLDPHTSLAMFDLTCNPLTHKLATGGSGILPPSESPQPIPKNRSTDATEGATGLSGSRVERRAATIAARRAATGYRIGDRAHTNTPRSPRFHNRVGTVVGINLGEVGLTFTGTGRDGRDAADAWFLPAELSKIRPAQGGHQ